MAKIVQDEFKDSGFLVRCTIRLAWLLKRKKIVKWIRLKLIADLIRGDQHAEWRFLHDNTDRLIIAAMFDPTLRRRTAERIARSIKHSSLGRVNLTADEVRKRLHSHLAKYVKSLAVGEKEVFKVRKKSRGSKEAAAR